MTLGRLRTSLLIVALLPASAHTDSNSQTGHCERDIPNRVQTETRSYVRPFQEVYRLYPKEVQKFFCQFPKFRIFKLKTSANRRMNFREGLFAANIRSSEWATWKEQLNFGMPNDNRFRTSKTLPRIEMNFGETREPSFLYFILLHELGHNVALNREQTMPWSKESSGERIPDLCSYWCGAEVFPRDRIMDLYQSYFYRSNLSTLYGDIFWDEDFADTFALYVMTVMSGFKYEIVLSDGKRLDLGKRLLLPRFQPKIDVLSALFENGLGSSHFSSLR